MKNQLFCISLLLIIQACSWTIAQPPPNDAAVMLELKRALILPNPAFWSDPDPCRWEQVQCINNRVKRIQIGDKGIKGTLPASLNLLSELQVFEVMRNQLTGPLPKFPGSVQVLLLNENQFLEIPVDFFKGMAALEIVHLDNNPFKQWTIPDTLQDAVTLRTFSAISANVTGTIPVFLAKIPSLTTLHLSFNNLEGEVPFEFGDSQIQSLWLNGIHKTSKLGGPIDFVMNMKSLVDIWLQGNKFIGPIRDLSALTKLEDFNIRDNLISGTVPDSLVNSPSLKNVTLSNNFLQGKMPKFRDGVVVDNVGNNRYCTGEPGVDCDPKVNVLLKIIEPMRFPIVFAENWVGNDACTWAGVICDPVTRDVLEINFQNKGLPGVIAPEFSQLASLRRIYLNNNVLHGQIPDALTAMPNLELLDVSFNGIDGVVPKFRPQVVVKHEGTLIV